MPSPVRAGRPAQRPRLAAIVLAAGSGSRFSDEPGGKLTADLHGRPLLEHVLDAVRAVRPVRTVVVVGHGRERLEQAIAWRGEERVVNADPDRGLSSSLRVGFGALTSIEARLDGAFIVLADQPLLRAEVLLALANAAAAALAARDDASPVAIAPRYEGAVRGTQRQPGPRNPVLLLRPGWALVAAAEGDRGLGPLLDRLGDAVLEVPVRGAMADVDTAADLAALSREGPAVRRHRRAVPGRGQLPR
jgi:molybdenum cofactor cytidylyltransferase